MARISWKDELFYRVARLNHGHKAFGSCVAPGFRVEWGADSLPISLPIRMADVGADIGDQNK